MKFEYFLTFFVLALFMLTAIVLISNPTLTGHAVLTQQACSIDTDCKDKTVCCLFLDKQAGVCDLKENCEAISEVTDTEKLPDTQLPAHQNPWLFYSILIGVFVTTIIVMVIFYKKNSDQHQ